MCGMCGAQLAAVEVVPEEVRKTVTVVFSDLKGSTALAERLDTEALREVLNQYFNAMRAVLERHGGTVEKYIGDAVMAVFGLPQLHEDDAMRAVRAAAEMQEELVGLNARFEEVYGIRIENRTGVNTGEVVAGDVSVGHRLVTGDTVNVAARLEQNAPTMEILLGEPTYRLVKDGVDAEPVEPLELKGKSERMPAYRLISVGQHEEGVARRLDAPMVGRDDELTVLTDALGRARASNELPGGDGGRARRDGQVTAPQGVRRPFRGSRPARAMPLLRRGPDVLAARGDREERRGDRQRRPGRRRDGEARGAPRAGGTRRRGSDRGRDRLVHGELSRGGDVLGRPALLRAALATDVR